MSLKRLMSCLMLAAIAASLLACHHQGTTTAARDSRAAGAEHVRTLPVQGSPVVRRVVAAAIEQTHYTSRYDAAYVQLDYPGGDVPLDRGACTDVIVRAFRKGGVDLQQSVHEDMARDFAAYPQTWGLPKPDSNIDHRRVPNLMTYFKRQGKSLPVTAQGEDYLPGDVVTWDLSGNGLTHIGMITNYWSDDTQNYLVVHNIGAGAKMENVLFAWHITGHYRYF
jgi:uncharacterized protein YijF (DUF1287 family)